MSLIQEIRSSVAPRDIDKFDDLVLKKEVEIMKVCRIQRLQTRECKLLETFRFKDEDDYEYEI